MTVTGRRGWPVLFLRGLRWRRGFAASVLVVGVICAAAAAIGPLYARAAAESTLTDELRAAAPATGMAFAATATTRDPAAVARTDREIGAAKDVPGYGPAIRGLSIAISAKTPSAAGSTLSIMVWREGQCAHLVITQGRCPTGVGEALVPAEALRSGPRWAVGAAFALHQSVTDSEGFRDAAYLGSARIVGAYRPRDTADPFWFDHPYFNSQLGPAVTSAIRGGVDAIFVGPAQFAAAPMYAPEEVEVDVPLIATRIRLGDVDALRRDVSAIQVRFPTERTDARRPGVRTGLDRALDDAARDKRQVETATLVVVLELVALSLFVLFRVVGSAVESRGDEIALAKVRGLPPRRTVAFALAEPLALLVVAAPLGLLAALGITHALAATVLVDRTPVALTGATWWALAAAFAGSALAAVLGATRTVTRPVLEQWRNTAPPRHGTRWLLMLDVGLAAAAITTVVVLRVASGSRPGAIFLLAPALIVFSAALVGARLLPWAGRRRVERTRASHRLAIFLALRQTVRRPGGLRLVSLLAVAAGVATFAVCGEAVARANRAARAQTETGAPRQLSVQFATGHDPQTAVAAADPDRKWAMAAAVWSPAGGPSSGHTVVGLLSGVEPTRLASTMYHVRSQLSPADLARDVSSQKNIPVTFRGRYLRVVLDTKAIAGDRPTVEIGVRRAHSLPALVPAGELRPGTRAYTARVDCADGCSFSGITIDRSLDAAAVITGAFVLRSVDVGDGDGARYVPIPLRLGDSAAWRADEIGVGTRTSLQETGGALAVTFRSTGGSSPVLGYADSPTLLPIVAAPRAMTEPAHTGGVADYTGTMVGYVVSRFASPLPVVLDTGAVADLDYLRIRLPNFDYEASWSVWLGPHAPSDAVARLTRAGLLVQHETTEASRFAALSRQGPALGLLLLLVCAVAAAVLAVGGTAMALLADSRRRAFELAALHVVGVPHRTLRRSAVAEQALLLGAAVVVGVPSGYLAAALVLPVVPEFADSTPVVLRYQPPVLAALACAAALVVLLWLTALVAGRALSRAAVPARLREAAR